MKLLLDKELKSKLSDFAEDSAFFILDIIVEEIYKINEEMIDIESSFLDYGNVPIGAFVTFGFLYY
jgi:hypothetical protein